MTWGNPPSIPPSAPKPGKKITPEQIAASGTEHGHQAALFCWAADSVGKYPCLEFMFAIPNGFYGDSGQKGKMKAEGLRSGVPDVMLPYAINDWDDLRLNYCKYHGCFIEMKVKKNKADANQIRYIDYLRSAGYYVAICYSWESARDTLIKYMEGKL